MKKKLRLVSVLLATSLCIFLSGCNSGEKDTKQDSKENIKENTKENTKENSKENTKNSESNDENTSVKLDLGKAEFDVYTLDDEKKTYSFDLDSRFVDEGNCGAGEVDCCYMWHNEDVYDGYSWQQINFYDEIEYEYDIIEKYLNGEKTKETVEELDDDLFKYKIVYNNTENKTEASVKRTAYVYVDEDKYFGYGVVTAEYDSKFIGTEVEDVMNAQLETVYKSLEVSVSK